jgi:hypothetical protein
MDVRNKEQKEIEREMHTYPMKKSGKNETTW